MSSETETNRWLDRFFVHLFSRRPVDGTFAGVRDYCDRLPDFSPRGLRATRDEMQRLLDDLAGLRRTEVDRFQLIDLDLAEGFLRTQLWEHSQRRFYETNPTAATGEAVFSLVSLFISDFRPVAEKAECLEARLAGLPAFLSGARESLTNSHPLWTQRAIRECIGANTFLTTGIPILRQDEGLRVTDDLVESAVMAFAEFQAFVEDELSSRPAAELACGEEAFGNIMRWAHQSEADPLAYAEHAEEIVVDCEAKLAEGAKAFGAATPEEAMAKLAEIHPSREDYLDTYTRLWQESRALAEREHLLTWAEFPIEYRPIPRWARDVQPLLYFLFYRCPPRFNRPEVYRYHVIPVDREMPAEEQERRLRSNNEFVIKTNHVLHHGGIGHHIQNWHAPNAGSRVGQVSMTDGAARITMLCGGTLGEGWACYATSLASDHGFLTPLEQYAELSAKRRMASRAVVDVNLHTGRFSLEDAVAFYRDRAKMPEGFARSEVEKNSLFPGGAIMYLYGIEGIERLRDEMKARKGPAFSLREFHDQFLSYGGVPVDRIAAEMIATTGDS